MRHHGYNCGFDFVREPEDFNINSSREFLQYSLGAILYMPASRDAEEIVLEDKFPGLTSLVLDFEDALPSYNVAGAEENVHDILQSLAEKLVQGRLAIEDLPLIFIRVRSPGQFKRFTAGLSPLMSDVLAGFVFPKFNTDRGCSYLRHLQWLNDEFSGHLYGLPILESREIAHTEKRQQELIELKELLEPHRNMILNLKVGTTDFSSLFGLRRSMDRPAYDLMQVRACIADILNHFTRIEAEYVISGPVWEYFNGDESIEPEMLDYDLGTLLKLEKTLINSEVEGLLRETRLDRASGFVGKIVIHPTHIKYVNALQTVTEEEYEDARQILESSRAVVKSPAGNKMNETGPHENWARKTVKRARAYGVVEEEKSRVQLFASGLKGIEGKNVKRERKRECDNVV